ncbi:MAG: DUF2156 domain-containing protein [Candidatus Obscuribacter sp.]|nr:DUF2156 domain-containing protein [Candidatus Obscuribacter sp.]MBP6347953.1 DUF2156 domain-containing protein [Candidatus Obscuribacter sp.]MBP6591406.1 DUF2156 domain-containing protein [Candidatus Obscuribacter sp.]MBP7575168.1 DUF2156 domain-containing protein [Candidatus Obscuribacter sp.]
MAAASQLPEESVAVERQVHAHDRSAQALADIREYATNTQSFLTLYQGFKHFRLPFVKGYAAYVESPDMLLVAGDPICPAESRAALIKGLMQLSEDKQKKLAMLPASADCREICIKNGFDAVYIGKEPIFDLQNMPKVSKSIRLAVNRAKRLGLRFEPFSEHYREQVLDLCNKWQSTRELPALQFLFQLRPFYQQEQKKLFLALNNQDQLMGFVACSPIYGRNGWYVEDLIRDESAPNGTTELLVTQTMQSLAAEGYSMATLAIAPLAGLPDTDENHPWLNTLLRVTYERLSFIYHFQTLEFFKGKFKPSAWEANYMYVYPSGISLNFVKHLIEAFLGESILAICKHKVKQLVGGTSAENDK